MIAAAAPAMLPEQINGASMAMSPKKFVDAADREGAHMSKS
jgi:hypothetical protein